MSLVITYQCDPYGRGNIQQVTSVMPKGMKYIDAIHALKAHWGRDNFQLVSVGEEMAHD